MCDKGSNRSGGSSRRKLLRGNRGARSRCTATRCDNEELFTDTMYRYENGDAKVYSRAHEWVTLPRTRRLGDVDKRYPR